VNNPVIHLRSHLLLALALSASQAFAQDARITIDAREKWTNVSADSKVDLH
jgi:hypothetical protein